MCYSIGDVAKEFFLWEGVVFCGMVLACTVIEPFYTAKRGSGLELHVVFNLVTQALRGKIFVTTLPDQGVEFRIELPTDLMA